MKYLNTDIILKKKEKKCLSLSEVISENILSWVEIILLILNLNRIPLL